ncbi:methyltransferase domain-containing protein [Helicobacter saguini]|uniref:Class I SAM-dependent methyltransferase n=1 Tax=Helicobacter saguini TaxID=1548018 RepID=A0A4U8T3Y2_9HELI|nr:class I SAM-dependent methyltransferase [Helicobacter saguini]MWV66833.1 methyltransferase domain-containing protein [Helicobacter saguini]MWV71262.1 methyltransferase domain-containing protein [Helicobacter saguini]TLD94220.1 class I SAM-dependent methyltransferase [Helicobacter saguini]
MQKILYTRKNTPVFAAVLYDSIDEASKAKVGDMQIVQDRESGVVFNAAFRQENVEYKVANYDAGKQSSGVFKNVLSEILEIIKRHFKGKKILEIGCGDGYFLEILEQNSFDIKGMDPSFVGENPLISKEYFTKDSKEKFECVILRHVLEHIKDYYGFLCDIAAANNNQGLVYIEVPNLDFSNNHFGAIDFYYEHVNYFRLENLESLFDKVIESGYIFGGEYIYIVANLDSIKKPRFKSEFIINTKIDSNIAMLAEKIKKTNTSVLWGGGG